MEMVIRLGEETWRIVGIYVRDDLDRKLEWIKERVERKEESTRILIVSDFNPKRGGRGVGKGMER